MLRIRRELMKLGPGAAAALALLIVVALLLHHTGPGPMGHDEGGMDGGGAAMALCLGVLGLGLAVAVFVPRPPAQRLIPPRLSGLSAPRLTPPPQTIPARAGPIALQVLLR